MIDVAVFAIPAKFVRAGADRGRREEDPRRGADPVRIRGDRQRRGTAGDLVEIGAQVRRAADGPEHLRLLLHVEEPVRDVLHRLRRQGPRGAVVAVRRHRHGDHRLLALGQDGRVGDRRARQQVATSTRTTCSRSSSRTTTRTIIAQHCEDLKDGRCVRRGREARLEEEAGGDAEGGPHEPRRPRRELAHGRARRQRQDLRRRADAVRRHPRAEPARPPRIRARRSRCCRRRRARTSSSSPAPAAPACCCPTPASTTSCR